MIDKIFFGQYISRRRRELGMTQIELAEKLHLSFQAISKWERGVSLPDRDTLMNLAKVLKIQGSWFAFESASSFSYKELVLDVNQQGVTGKNYLSIGAMLMSEGFTHKLVKEFDDQKIRDTLDELLTKKSDWVTMSLLALSHHFCDVYCTRLDYSFIASEIQATLGLNLGVLHSKKDYPSIIIRKIMTIVSEVYAPCALLVVNEYTVTNDIQIEIVCSKDLVEKGFNCSYLRVCLEPAIFSPEMVAGSSGGGNQFHSSIVIHPNEKHALRTEFFQSVKKLFINYIRIYQKPFQIVLKE